VFQNIKVYGPDGKIQSVALPTVSVDLDVLFAAQK